MSDLIVREYLRVSKDDGKTGKSPDQQHNENLLAFEREGLVPHRGQPYQDVDRSASRYAKAVREGFERLIADLQSDSFGADVLAIWESSRGSRRVSEWSRLIELCEERGVRIWVTTHGRMYDPSNARDRRSLHEDAVDAEYESDKTSDRIRRDVRAAAKEGKPHGKNVYGYQRVYDQATRKLLRVEPHPDQAPIVKEAARRIMSGGTFYSVAKILNERGIPPRRPTLKDHRANYGWTSAAVKQMLTMPTYAGKRQHKGEIVGDAVWPSLIDYVDWVKLQAIISPPERSRTNFGTAKHLLAGIALCGVCGAPLRVGKQNAGRKRTDTDGKTLPRVTYRIYECPGVPGRAGPDGKMGFHVGMKQKNLDKAVVEALLARLEGPDFLASLYDRGGINDAERQAELAKISRYQKYLEEVREEAAAKLRFDLLMDQEKRIEPKIKEAQSRLEELSEMDPLVLRLVSDGAIREAWANLDLDEQRRGIRAVMAPRVNRIGKNWRGHSGVNKERVDPGWR